MTDPTANPEDVLKKLSRRKLLRNSAITATGAVLLPTFLTGCHKDAWDIVKGQIPGGGLGAVELTTAELEAAAANLNRMRALLADLYNIAYKYDGVVFLALGASRQNSNWTNFIVDIAIDIAAAMASAAAIVAEGPLAVPAIACLSAFLHDWGIGKDRPIDLSGLNGFFADYEDMQIKMAHAIDEKLGHLTDENYPTNDYANLKAAWKDPIVFNGASYTLADLANSYFPEKNDNADDYYKIYDPMYLHHQKSVWNLAIMRCCGYYENYHVYVGIPKTPGALIEYAQQTFYPQNKGVYLRARYVDTDPDTATYELIYYNLGIGGYAFPDVASNILFMDDTPGHIINPDGLFNRSYVFEQFSKTKPDFLTQWHELGSNPSSNFSFNDDWNFTGGLFPNLTH